MQGKPGKRYYSSDTLLGDLKTVITIPKADSQVLGVATENTDFSILILSGALFILLMISVILLFKTPSWLNKKINFGVEDIVFLIAGLSAFGLGFCVGYLLIQNLFPGIL